MTVKKTRSTERRTKDLKTGLYGRRFRSDEVNDLEMLLEGGLDSEIVMLRVVTRRFFERSNQDEELCEAADTLGKIGLAVTRLSCLLKAQKLLGSGDEHGFQVIQSAIAQVSNEMELSL